MIDFGIVKPGRTLYVPFSSFAGATGASITLTGLAVTDIEIYKDGSVTQRSSDAGYTLLDTDGIDFDGITGIHGFSISLADNTDAGFYAAGSRYFVVVSAVTIDSQTVSFVACTFAIGHPDAVLSTTIATLASQTSFTLTVGPAEDDALNDMWLIVHDVASAVQMAVGIISDYTGSTKTVTLAAAPTFTMAATDNIMVMGPMPLQPATAARKPVVDAAGLVDANTVKVGPSGSGTAQTAGDLAALINTVDDLLDTEVAAILAAVDTEVAAIVAATTAAAIRTALGLASANLDTQLDALPTNAELATALGTADDAVLAAIAALNNLSQANIRTALGMASANLDTQLSTIDDFLDTEVAAILAAVDTEIGTIITNIASLFTTAMTESYSTDGATATPAQALYEIIQMLTELSFSGTTGTVKKRDGITTALTLTINSATTPTSITRAS